MGEWRRQQKMIKYSQRERKRLEKDIRHLETIKNRHLNSWRSERKRSKLLSGFHVFLCNQLDSRWPVGTAVLALAKDEDEARILISLELHRRGFRVLQRNCRLDCVELLNLENPSAVVFGRQKGKE